jgi:hypothetical protein
MGMRRIQSAVAVVLASSLLGLSAGCRPGNEPYATEPPNEAPGDAPPEIHYGIGGAEGPSIRYAAFREKSLDFGLGAGYTSEAFFLGPLKLDYSLLTLRTDDGDWGGMAEATLGGGLAIFYAGGGAAVPLWDGGDLDLHPAFTGYVGVWAPIIERDWDVTVTARYAWYSREARVSGEQVDLEGWQFMLSVMKPF